MRRIKSKKSEWTWGRVGALIGSILIFVPVVYGISTVLLSTPFNRAFHYLQECTIVGAAEGESRSKSYSDNSYVFVKTTDCPRMRYTGDRNGLTRQEVADRINRLEGQKVRVDVGYWQVPFSDTL